MSFVYIMQIGEKEMFFYQKTDKFTNAIQSVMLDTQDHIFCLVNTIHGFLNIQYPARSYIEASM